MLAPKKHKEVRMIVRRPFAAFLIALSITACSKTSDDKTAISAPTGPVAATPPPAGKAWTDIVEKTAEDGYRMGNPNAPIKIVEYGSFTCPHCKVFEDEASDPLQQKYIATGKVSWEFRAMVIHGGPDVSIGLLMQCRGPEPYFKLAQQLYATQETWFSEATIKKLNDTMPQMQNQPPTEQFKATIDALGLYPFFGARGLPRAQAESCLSDQKAIAAMTATQQRYSTADGVDSTPTFVINGVKWEPVIGGPSIWKQLDPQLAKMAG